MWVLCFPHHKCQKILSNHESQTSDLMSFWHEWCGKTHTHISNLTVFTLLETTITQIWQFFWKICQIVVKCVHEFYCHFVKCVHWSLFNSFFTIVVFNYVQWSFSQLFQSLFCYFGIVRFILFHLFLIFLSKIDSRIVNIRSLNLFPIEHIECNNSIGSTPVGKFDIKSR